MEHGGNIYKIEEVYNIDKESIVDFSDNVNPLGVPFNVKKAIIDNVSILSRYPDPDYRELRKAISKYIDVDYNYIVVGNGATEIISLLIKSLYPSKALLVMPAYSEYERELKLNGANIVHYVLEQQLGYKGNIDELCEMAKSCDLIVVCNPDNPTGTAFTRDEVKRLLDVAESSNVRVMIDETYVEFTEDIKMYSSVEFVEDYKNLFIIRGLSKFFGIPGLRVGYGITSDDRLISDINVKKDPWSVNLLADMGARAALSDIDYIRRSQDFMRTERRFLSNAIREISNIKLYDSVCNFFLCQLIDSDKTAKDITKDAIKYGLLLRDASNIRYLNDKQFRVCVKQREQNMMLINFLRDYNY